MNTPQKRSHVTEVHWENALTWGGLGLLALIAGLFFLFYGEGWGRFLDFPGLDFRAVSWPLFVASPVMIGYAIYRVFATRKEGSYFVACPYCNAEMEFAEPPDDDFVCDSCHRRVSVKDGRVLDVMGVRCGFCGALNYLSEKTEVLLCEECDREIPLLDPETGEMKRAPRGFARVDDDSLYELVLVDVGRDREGLINSLQHMLALNRNQVKAMLENLPVTLLTGINRRKAEMLRAQLEASDATAEMNPLSQQSPQ